MLLLNFILFKNTGNISLLKRSRPDFNTAIYSDYGAFHRFHILNPSPWPASLAISLLSLTVGAVLFFHFKVFTIFLIGLLHLIFVLFLWFRDIVDESIEHTPEIRFGLRLGMILFIASEVLFFFSFFWTFFYLALAPAVELGCSWPPVGLNKLILKSLFTAPLVGTLLLLLSGVTVTCVHKYLEFNLISLKKHLFQFSLVSKCLL